MGSFGSTNGAASAKGLPSGFCSSSRLLVASDTLAEASSFSLAVAVGCEEVLVADGALSSSSSEGLADRVGVDVGELLEVGELLALSFSAASSLSSSPVTQPTSFDHHPSTSSWSSGSAAGGASVGRKTSVCALPLASTVRVVVPLDRFAPKSEPAAGTRLPFSSSAVSAAMACPSTLSVSLRGSTSSPSPWGC